MSTGSSTTPFQIPVRHDVTFDFGATPAHHFAGSPRTSHLWNAVSILAPQTEAFLIRAIKRARDEVQDDVLRQQVDALLTQEALHTRHHKALNTRLAELGYALQRASHAAERSLRRLTDRDDVRSALALVIGGEYAIYMLARAVLEDPALLAPTTPEVRRLLVWHAPHPCALEGVRGTRGCHSRNRGDPDGI
jgi:predicted metal-dependent hydrolase